MPGAIESYVIDTVDLGEVLPSESYVALISSRTRLPAGKAPFSKQ